ncbi:MAG: CPBP family intramembrane glutamic endopeptidase [Akkermansiaceae bacterium]
MKRFFKSEAGATVLWVLASLLLAAVIAPWLYQGGKALAAAAADHELPAILEWLAAACDRAKFGRYFNRALAFSALLLLPVLCKRICALKAESDCSVTASAKPGARQALLQTASGCALAAAMLWGLGMIMVALGAYAPAANPPELGKFLSKVLIPAVGAPLVEEWLFRGILLGLWLRSARPLPACLGTSLVFAFVHFLEPPAGFAIANPGAPLAGFELLRTILFHFADPMFFLTDFATLVLVGMILAQARVRTGALWLSIGLHAGWIIAFKGYNLIYKPVYDHPLQPWGVGESLRSGLFPLLVLGLTGVICHFALRHFDKDRQPA